MRTCMVVGDVKTVHGVSWGFSCCGVVDVWLWVWGGVVGVGVGVGLWVWVGLWVGVQVDEREWMCVTECEMSECMTVIKRATGE